MKMTVREFLPSVAAFAEMNGWCPRCGDTPDVMYRSNMSGVPLCDRCFLDELPPERENFDNWAVLVGIRTVCDTDIKICKECDCNVVSNYGYSNGRF